MRSEAPLFTKTYDLVLWLMARTQSFPKSQRFVLGARVMDHAFEVLEAISLALRGFDRADNVARADSALALLRVYLRLAADSALLRRRQLVFATERIEELGKMVGGWQKRL